MNHTFFKILALDQFLQITARHQQTLVAELKNHACDPVLRMRRIRMLRQLAIYESETIKKIDSFDSDDIEEWLDIERLIAGVENVVNRSA